MWLNLTHYKISGVQVVGAHVAPAHEGQALVEVLEETALDGRPVVALDGVRDVVLEEPLAEVPVRTAEVHLLNDLAHLLKM